MKNRESLTAGLTALAATGLGGLILAESNDPFRPNTTASSMEYLDDGTARQEVRYAGTDKLFSTILYSCEDNVVEITETFAEGEPTQYDSWPSYRICRDGVIAFPDLG